LALLKERILSALVLAPLALGALHKGGIGFLALTALVVGCSSTEYRKMLHGTGLEVGRLFVPVCTVIALSGYSNRAEYFLASILIGSFILAALSAELGITAAVFGVAGAIYIGGFFGTLGLLRSGPGGREWSFLVLFATWATDVGAYFGGTALGKHKIAPKISPKKSWEGAVLGLVCSMIVSGLWGRHIGLPLFFSVLAGACLGVMAEIGDLVESGFKRYCNVKDSGRAIPGHGGFLDRLDSLLFASLGGLLLKEVYMVFFQS
jgi:phosphatidate cytidylyltransferase